MNQFTIKDIENLCGIKAHTLRIWEQRYNLFVAKRKESLHRIYDNDDLKELLRIAFLYHNGHKISKIACLSKEEIDSLVQRSCSRDENNGVFVHQLLEAAVDFDKEKFEKILNCVAMRIGLEKCIADVFYPLLHRIGLLWMTNNVIPAQEHFTSHIIRKKIILAVDGLEPVQHTDNNVLIFAPEGEHHEIPLLTANYFFKKNNCATVYFGANVSMESVKYYCNYHQVSRFYCHVITHLDNCSLENTLIKLCREFPDKEVVVSGPAIKCTEPLPGNLIVLRSLNELINFAKSTNEKS